MKSMGDHDHSSVLGDLRLGVALARAVPGCEVRFGPPEHPVRYGGAPSAPSAPPGEPELRPLRPLGRLAASVAAAWAGGSFETVRAEVGLPGAELAGAELDLHGGAWHVGGGVYEALRGDQVVDLFATLLDPPATRRTLRRAEGAPHLVGPDAWEGLHAPRPRVHLIGAHDVGATIVAVRFGPWLLPPVVEAIRRGVLAGRAACLVGELAVELDRASVRDRSR